MLRESVSVTFGKKFKENLEIVQEQLGMLESHLMEKDSSLDEIQDELQETNKKISQLFTKYKMKKVPEIGDISWVIEKEVTLGVKCDYCACYNPVSKEIWVKQNFRNPTITKFSASRLTQTGTLDINFGTVIGMCVDPDGNIYVGNNDKNWAKFSPDGKTKIWEMSYNQKAQARGIFYSPNEKKLYAALNNGPLLTIAPETGQVLSEIQSDFSSISVFSIVVVGDELVLSSAAGTRRYTKQGQFIKKVNDFKYSGIIFTGEQLWIQNNRTTQWTVWR